MTRIKITPEQLERVMLREQTADLLMESPREVMLGVARILGLKLSGINDIGAQKAVTDEKIMGEIKKTLENPNKLKVLSKTFGEKGLVDPEIYLAKNAKKIVDGFNKIATANGIKKSVSRDVIINLIELDSDLAKKYELKKPDTDAQSGSTTTQLTIKDKFEVEFPTDTMFDLDGKLTLDGETKLEDLIKTIKSSGGKIQSISVVSSTDAQPNYKFKKDHDSSGNIELALVRVKTITKFLEKLDKDISFSHREIPNNGSHVVSMRKFTDVSNREELEKLKKKTEEFRYLRLTMVVDYTNTLASSHPIPEIILTKLRTKIYHLKDKYEIRFVHKKLKCNKKIGVISCSSL